MSGSIGDRSSLPLSPARPDARPASPQPSAAAAPGMAPDGLALSPAARGADPSEADRILDLAIRPALAEAAERREVFVPDPFAPAPSKAPFAIQKLRFADNYDNGRETELTFERYPGDLTPPPPTPFSITRDPRTGSTDLALKEMRGRISGGDYDIYFKVDGDGSIGIDRVMRGGRNVTSVAKDALVAKIKEDPALYGTLTALAAAGAVAAAHEHARRSGAGIEFDALSHTLLERDDLQLKTKLKAELTGDSSFVRPSSAELAAHYGDGRLEAFASAQYRVRDESWEANVGASYKLDKNVDLSAGAFYRTDTSDYGAFVSLRALF